MSVRLSLFVLAMAGVVASAQAQDVPVARSHADSEAALTAPPPLPASTKPTTVAAAVADAPPAPITTRAGDETAGQIADWLKADASPVQPLDPHAETPDAPGPRQIHGEVGAYVSNRGYGGYAATSLPLGEASELDLAVSGEHIHTRWGNANPRSVGVGLYLDGGDIGRWLSHDTKCNVPRWGVSLPGDPQVTPDGSCVKTASDAARPTH